MASPVVSMASSPVMRSGGGRTTSSNYENKELKYMLPMLYIVFNSGTPTRTFSEVLTCFMITCV
jgi:hypothetical protein